MAATIAKHQVTCLYLVFKAKPCKDLLDSICPTIEVDFNRNQLWTARGPWNTPHTHTQKMEDICAKKWKTFAMLLKKKRSKIFQTFLLLLQRNESICKPWENGLLMIVASFSPFDYQ